MDSGRFALAGWRSVDWRNRNNNTAFVGVDVVAAEDVVAGFADHRDRCGRRPRSVLGVWAGHGRPVSRRLTIPAISVVSNNAIPLED